MPYASPIACWCGKIDCKRHKTKAFIVCGPPGSGKSTYVKQHKQPDDLIFDFDAVMQAITGLPMHHRIENALDFVLRMRDGFTKAASGDSGVNTVWIISSDPTREDRESLSRELPNSEIIVLDESESVCIQRTAHRGEQWASIVHHWFLRRNA